MKSESRIHARDYITRLASAGRYHFSSSEAQGALGVSAAATKLALHRLSKQGLIASPARGFYVIVPPEYHSLGSLPAEQFIPALMKRLGQLYYAGLLSAAQFHGAAHHRPQEFQVMVAKARRPIVCGAVRVGFVVRKNIAFVPTQSFNTPRGTVLVSTPEATAIDLVGYHDHVGGLDQVATILGELAENIDPEKLVAAAETAPVPWAQRLGYLMDQAGADDRTGPLKAYVRNHARSIAVLLPAAPHKNAVRDDDWRLAVNVAVESEL
ncbi:type IV toxin-antitoxin system AbiEi family antitoxin [Mesorhizobium sp. YIM 152430]|uniref:type IV toxin-antitoxin system AbiEi family antitoxin n=1 Tax=Mesorhizobium sp. YIM 152430 TaxID=3031761 RepID=UPI0023DB374B|nr:type IV toxin-antitoxin system AbiEi family antitoxin [Mesorhizobium sp. YIM 152430]MDF1600933.1 type IV toxin-antitoxin system AbiEi family antitoxin [Mesorhizobium sp. YIM 152430]